MCSVTSNATRWYQRVIGVWSQVDPGSEVQEQFLSKKITLSWVVAHLPSVASIKVWKARTAFRLKKICLVSSAMFTRARGIKNLPGMHCDHVLQDKRQDRTRQDKVKLITELIFSFFISTNNGQQEAIDWNIDLWSRLRWFYFKSARFAVF